MSGGVEVLTEYRRLRKEGRTMDAAAGLRGAMRSLDAGTVAQAGRLLLKDLPLAYPQSKPLDVLVLGQCTTSYLIPLLCAWAWEEGLHLRLKEGGYDQVVQSLMNLTEPPDVIVLLPWNQRLLAGDDRDAVTRVDDELDWLRQAWSQVERLKSKFIQVAYDNFNVGALGYSLSSRRDGDAALVGQVNAALTAQMPAGSAFIDLPEISAWEGKAVFYDERNYHWLKQPFSPLGLSVLARHLAAQVRTLTSGRRKVLVLDLDNTLWGGVVGEVGAHGVAIGGSPEGEAFSAFQRHVKRLRASGVLLAVCSKNNDADAREPFEKNTEMVLKLEDFAAFHASWNPKSGAVRSMAQTLNLGLESFVFFDDSPVERAQMRAELPEVTVVDVPAEPAHYVRALVESLAFEALDLNAADSGRAAQYAAEASRRTASALATTPQEYLASLQMVASLEAIDEANLGRVVDLITKTNQFNLTTRRHSVAAVRAMLARHGSICFAVRLEDKFGDYGIVSVLLGLGEGTQTLRIDTWLMSCRAMGRTVEHLVMNQLVNRAREEGYTRLLAEYLPTAKNAPVANLLPEFGFEALIDNKATSYSMALASFRDVATQIKLKSSELLPVNPTVTPP